MAYTWWSVITLRGYLEGSNPSYALAYHIMDAHYRFKFIRSSYGTPLRLVFNLGAKYHFLSGVLRRELQNSFYYIENFHSLNDILSI